MPMFRETVSPLVTGVSHAVYSRVASLAEGGLYSPPHVLISKGPVLISADQR